MHKTCWILTFQGPDFSTGTRTWILNNQNRTAHSGDNRTTRSRDNRTTNSRDNRTTRSRDNRTTNSRDGRTTHSRDNRAAHSRDNRTTHSGDNRVDRGWGSSRRRVIPLTRSDALPRGGSLGRQCPGRCYHHWWLCHSLLLASRSGLARHQDNAIKFEWVEGEMGKDWRCTNSHLIGPFKVLSHLRPQQKIPLIDLWTVLLSRG